jgi:hypothetical protein
MAETVKFIFFKRQTCWHLWSNRQHLLSSNGKTVTSALFKWQNRQNLLSSNGETVNTYCHQTAKQSTPIVFKRQNCHI